MNRHSFVGAAGTVLLAVGLSLGPVRQASAEYDYKFISATDCQPFLPTTYETAIFKDNAIYNPTNVNQRVICPINKEALADWTAGNVFMYFHIKAGAKPGKVACTVYGSGVMYGTVQVAYTSTSPTLDPGEVANYPIDDIADPVGGLTYEGWNVLCTLNSNMSLGGFTFGENYDTDGGN